MIRKALLIAFMFAISDGWAAQQYSARGLVLKVNPSERTVVVSCENISGYMDAMVMSFSVRKSKTLDGIAPGMMIDFKLVVDKDSSHVESIRIRSFDSPGQEPQQARRLKLLQDLATANPSTPSLIPGQQVPDFTLTDQKQRKVSLAQFSGKVVAVNFVYTRCPLPEYCYRLSNNFGRLQKRFAEKMGKDLVLLTISFDPVHDQPAVLAEYARTWKADGEAWRFLTGPTADIQRVCSTFGVDSWQDEATLTHTLHTALIGRDGKLVANLEGNQFTAEQLGDLVQTVLDRPK